MAFRASRVALSSGISQFITQLLIQLHIYEIILSYEQQHPQSNNKTVVRISERFIESGQETKIQELMIGVRKQVLRQPGLLNMDTVVDCKDPNCYAVITEWASKQHLKAWLKSDLCKDVSERLKTVLKRPTKHRQFREAEEDIFLL